MDKHLFIAYKPSVAKEFAKVLGVQGSQRKGYPESWKYVVTWRVRHLVTMIYPDVYDPALKNRSLIHFLSCPTISFMNLFLM